MTNPVHHAPPFAPRLSPMYWLQACIHQKLSSLTRQPNPHLPPSIFLPRSAAAAVPVVRHPPVQQPLHPNTVFTAAQLNANLYGYHDFTWNNMDLKHAMSGLRTNGNLNHGIDRILSPSTKSQRSPAIDSVENELPPELEVVESNVLGCIHHTVFVKPEFRIAKGHRFGPYRGRQVNMSEVKTNDDNSYMWEIFKNGQLSHFIDGRCASGNWMSFVNTARIPEEQNLAAVQDQDQIFYDATTDITGGRELLVWYGDNYTQFMGIPIGLKRDTKTDENAASEPADGNDENEEGLDLSGNRPDGYQCERCGKVFAYRYYRDKHLKYTRCVDLGDRKFPCHLCTRSFEKRDRLRIHVLHVHEKHRPHKCIVCSKSFSQSSSLNKHMRVHSGERPYKCVYCNKAFTASSILRTHIRQHSGEKPFKCRHCGKAFASHAAHDSHVRRTHTAEKTFACNVCSKTFILKSELKFHMNLHTGDRPYQCGKCGLCFPDPITRDQHQGQCTPAWKSTDQSISPSTALHRQLSTPGLPVFPEIR